MSFMGSIGSMMKGSGLEEALGTVYGQNACSYPYGFRKAVSRALRGHFLVEAALFNTLMLAVLPRQEDDVQMEHSEGEDKDNGACNEDFISEVALAEDKLNFDDIQKIHDLYEGIQGNSVTTF